MRRASPRQRLPDRSPATLPFPGAGPKARAITLYCRALRALDEGDPDPEAEARAIAELRQMGINLGFSRIWRKGHRT